MTQARATTETPLQAAAHWRMRLEAPDRSPGDEAAFEAWLAEDELHRRAWERTAKVWDLVDAHAATPDLMVIRRNALHRVHNNLVTRPASRRTNTRPSRHARSQ